MDRKDQIDTFSRFTNVSRETIKTLKIYEKILIKENRTLNLIGKSTINVIWERHFLDSAQVVDYIEENDEILVDVGSGAGFPGLVLAILFKDRNIAIKTKLIEKSPKKSNFLRSLIKELSLNVEVINEDIFSSSVNFSNSVFVARAFKPIKIILELMHKKNENCQKIFLFMGKSGNEELIQATKFWDIEYKQRVSLTNDDSKVLEINKLKKKN